MPESTLVRRYSLAMRLLHWIRAVLILGMLTLGIVMTSIPDSVPAKFALMYPNHKQFGILVWLLVLVQLVIRWRSVRPAPPPGLKAWERRASHIVHVAMYVLALIVPMMGYAMSSSFTQSDGVPFFGLAVPELLPKNDAAFAVFDDLHQILAYALLGCVVLHLIGVVKHRYFDSDPGNDVLPRML